MIKVKRIRHATFQTPDLKPMQDYYQTIVGFGRADAERDRVLFASDSEQLALVLEKGERPTCSRIAFELAPHVDLMQVKQELQQAGFSPQILTDHLPGIAKALLFTDLEGTEIELLVGWVPTPHLEGPSGIVVKQLGHIALYSSDPLTTSQFYGNSLGFRVSDWIADVFCFMRCGPDHHTLNFVKGRERRLHHIAFELRDGSHMHAACDLLGRKNLKILWGPVRHGPGHNVAIYHRDPDGHLVEMFYSIDRMVDEELGYFEPQPWHADRPQRPKVWLRGPSDKWGLPPDPDLLEFTRRSPFP